MTVTINGEKQEVPEGLNINSLLVHLGVVPGRVAVERNLEVVPRSRWEAISVQADDTYEIVHFIGGGQCPQFSRLVGGFDSSVMPSPEDM